MHRAGREGFTLIELSIVLVIIGLIIGGVLVGRDLIRAAGVRATISQIEKYNTTVNTFFGKYNCLPGDCEFAQSLFVPGGGEHYSDTANLVNGNGNGQLEFSYDVFTYGTNGTDEVSQFFLHLSAAQMADGFYNPFDSQSFVGSGNGYPAAKGAGSGNGIMAFYFNGSNQWYIGISPGPACIGGHGVANAGCLTDATFTPGEAYAIDTKTDDGNPTSGKAQAYWGVTESDQLATPGFGQAPGAAVCANTSSTYNISAATATQPLCQMMIQFQ